MPLFWKSVALTVQACEAEAAEIEREEQKDKAATEARRLRQLGH